MTNGDDDATYNIWKYSCNISINCGWLKTFLYTRKINQCSGMNFNANIFTGSSSNFFKAPNPANEGKCIKKCYCFEL